MMRVRRLGLLAVLAAPLAAFAQSQPLPRNAFAGVETVVLANGLKVWFKRLPGDPTVSVSVSVPSGSDADPVGREQLAHFTEHMLFSDQPGRTEAQVKHEVDERGGTYNGFTGWDRTFYFVRIGAAHGPFAIDWMYRLVSPHAMDAAVVDRQREPVALEVRARPRQFFDWIFAGVVNPPLLRMPDFWEREFGLATRNSRDYDPWRSLHRITAADLRGYYDRHYVPSRMTLTVIGDVDRDSIMARVGATFATWPARAASPDTVILRDSGRQRTRYFWEFRSNVDYGLRYRLGSLNARERVIAIFLTRWLGKRLNDQLRFGERKAAYGIGVYMVHRGPASYLAVAGGLKHAEFAFARRVVDDEFEALRAGTRPAAEFEADREAVARQLRVQDASAKELEEWVGSEFFDDHTFREFPDLVTAFETMPKADVEAFARQRLGAQAQVLDVTEPSPLSEGVAAVLAAALAWCAVRVARRLFIRPVDMTRIRYVARFRYPLLYWLTVFPAILVLLAVLLRLLIFGAQVLGDRVVGGIGSVWIQASIYAILASIVVIVMIAALGRLPRKVLRFDDGVVIKYLAYRSVRIAPDDIAGVELCRFTDVWLSRRLWSCWPLTLGLMQPAIYLRRRAGRSIFFSVRDRDECLRALRPDA